MKKFIILNIILSTIFTASAVEFNVQEAYNNAYKKLVNNRETLDQNVVKEVNDYLNTVETKTDAQKLCIIKYKLFTYDQTKGADNSFDGLKTYLEKMLSDAKLDKPVTEAKKLEMMDIWYKYSDKDFIAKMYNAIKVTPNGHKFADAGWWAQRAKQYNDAYNFYMENQVFPDRCVEIAVKYLNDPQKALSAAKLVADKTYPVEVVNKVVGLVLENIVTNKQVNQEDVKTFLQDINKRYSRLMKEDEKAWAPIIGDVRMTLGAY